MRLWLLVSVLCVLLVIRPYKVQAKDAAVDPFEDEDDDDDAAVDGDAAGSGSGSGGAHAAGGAAGGNAGTAHSKDSHKVDHDEYFDEDEFVGVPPSREAPSAPAQPAAAGSGKPTPTPTPRAKASSAAAEEKPSYVYEALALCLLAAFGINYYLGKAQNDKLARAWYSAVQPIFDSQFAAAPAYGGADAAEPALLSESAYSFKYYASGRRHCSGAMCSLELKKRHDLLSLVLGLFDVVSNKDIVTVEVPLVEDMDSFVFCIAPKKAQKKLRTTYKDLENYAGTVSSSRLSDSLVVMTDAPELERLLVDDRVARVLQQSEDSLLLIHATDQNSQGEWGAQKNVLRVSYQLRRRSARDKDGDDMAEAVRLTELTMYLIDTVVTVRLSAPARAKAQKKRKEVADALFRSTHQQRQEIAAQRRQEQKKQEEENAIKNMTPEQLKKKEEKDYKLSLKKKTPKVKVIR